MLVVGATVLACFVDSPRIFAQSATTDWERAAGGKMSFDVGLCQRRLGSSQRAHPTRERTVRLGRPFLADRRSFLRKGRSLFWYIRFAYKLTPTQFSEIVDQLPKWALTNRYDIEARASGNPTKDQYRLMMQSLLAGRLKLAFHYQTKRMPVLALRRQIRRVFRLVLSANPRQCGSETTGRITGLVRAL